MRLFIQIRDGIPFEHPILEENFLTAFPDINPEELPASFAYFERIPKPSLPLQKVVSDTSEYVWDNGIVKDSWPVRDKTSEELDTDAITILTSYDVPVDAINDYMDTFITLSYNDKVSELGLNIHKLHNPNLIGVTRV